MPADTLTIPISGPLAEDIRAEAEARGLTVEQFAAQALELGVELARDAEDLSWDEDLRRLEEPGENVPAEQAFAEVRARLAARLDPQK
jgi:hypothetical protein